MIRFACLVMALSVSVTAQTVAPPAPTLSEVQKLTILTTAQRLEIAKLRADAAQKEWDGLVRSLTVPGWTLDLQTMTYVKKEEPKGKP